MAEVATIPHEEEPELVEGEGERRPIRVLPEKCATASFKLRQNLEDTMAASQAEMGDDESGMKRVANDIMSAMLGGREGKMDPKKLGAIDQLMVRIYKGVRPFWVGQLSVDPIYLRAPPSLIANKDFYEEHVDKLQSKLRTMGEAFPPKNTSSQCPT